MDCKMLNEDGFGVQCCNSSSAKLRLQIVDWRAPTEGSMIVFFQKISPVKNIFKTSNLYHFYKNETEFLPQTLIYKKLYLFYLML